MRSLFLSHTGIDKDVARTIYHDLVDRGLQVWFDEAEIEPGGSIQSAISSAMDYVDCVGVLLTPSSVSAPWVVDELRRADWVAGRGGRITVLPLLLIGLHETKPFIRDLLGFDLRQDFSAGVDRLAAHLLEESHRVELPPQGRMARVMKEAGPGRWQKWTRGSIGQTEAADRVAMLRRTDFVAAIEVARRSPVTSNRVISESEVVDSVIRSGANPDAASARQIARRLIDDLELLVDAEDGVSGNLIATPLCAAVKGAARRGGFHSTGGRIGTNPERLSELLVNAPDTTRWMTGTGWTALTFDSPVARAPAQVPIRASFVRGTIARPRQVHTVVWTHEDPERTFLFSTGDDRTPEMLADPVTIEDLSLELTANQKHEIRQARLADSFDAKAIGRSVAYPEVTLEIFDDLQVLRRIHPSHL